jgi:pSer/pThr/pTyr-binding forkhead associated (FHA) protein
MVGRSFYLIANNQAYRYYRAGPDATKVVTDPQVVMRLAVPC